MAESAKDKIEIDETQQKLESVDIGGKEDVKVTYYLRDINRKMVVAWENIFKDHTDRVQVSLGDIFKDAPAADAIVSPANSFGFMDGGIDMVYTILFGWQMQNRLQKVIREEYDGENLVGNAIIIPAYDKEPEGEQLERIKKKNCNGGQPIKYLISVPTMRIPEDVSNTSNAFLAFRAVILSVQKHNRNPDNTPIRSVLCPGLGTAVGLMPADRCAFQMLQAYEFYDLKIRNQLLYPETLWRITGHGEHMAKYRHVYKDEKESA